MLTHIWKGMKRVSTRGISTAVVSSSVSSDKNLAGPIKLQADGSIRLNLHVKPGVKKSQIVDMTDLSIGVQISAPPRDGEANEEVLRYISEVFNLRPRHLELATGHKSRDKVVLIRFDDPKLATIEHANRILQGELNSKK